MKQTISTMLTLIVITCFSLPANAQIGIARKGNKPVKLRHEVETESVDFRVTVTPGVPAVGETVKIEISVSQILPETDAVYGNRKPLGDAKMTGILVSPPRSKRNKGQAIARQGLALSDVGSYGMTFTSNIEGVHALYVQGQSPTTGKITFRIPVSFGVWPVSETQTQNLPRKPRRVPTATSGDLVHGKTLCKTYCNTGLPFAYPTTSIPSSINSDTGIALGAGALVKKMLGDSIGDLGEIERNDLEIFLNSLFVPLRSFFPAVAQVMPASMKLNEYALQRLGESGIKLPEGKQEAVVFVVYRGNEKSTAPEIVAFEDRIARSELSRKNKIGYVVFFYNPKDPDAYEIGFGLGLEPIYTISNITVRKQNGKLNHKLNRALRAFKRSGRFNNARSLKGGTASLRRKFTPMYLKAAEFATMYFSDEREFSAFDAELGE